MNGNVVRSGRTNARAGVQCCVQQSLQRAGGKLEARPTLGRD